MASTDNSWASEKRSSTRSMSAPSASAEMGLFTCAKAFAIACSIFFLSYGTMRPSRFTTCMDSPSLFLVCRQKVIFSHFIARFTPRGIVLILRYIDFLAKVENKIWWKLEKRRKQKSLEEARFPPLPRLEEILSLNLQKKDRSTFAKNWFCSIE